MAEAHVEKFLTEHGKKNSKQKGASRKLDPATGDDDEEEEVVVSKNNNKNLSASSSSSSFSSFSSSYSSSSSSKKRKAEVPYLQVKKLLNVLLPLLPHHQLSPLPGHLASRLMI